EDERRCGAGEADSVHSRRCPEAVKTEHALRVRPTHISPRRRNHPTVRATHSVGKTTPSSAKAPALPMAWAIQPKFMPKNPVMNVRGRKISDTSVSRLI